MTQQEQLKELIKAHEERLYALELTKARQGYETPPSIHTEISKVTIEINKLQAKLAEFGEADIRGIASLSEKEQQYQIALRWIQDGRKMSLTRFDLSGADLEAATLAEAALGKANLNGANLYLANLTKADLQRASLQNADLRRANLSEANLWEANLEGADLREADLSGANLREVNLSGADLRGANLWDVDLRGAILREADLIQAYLGKANLRGADLRGADLRYAKLPAHYESTGGYIGLMMPTLQGAELSKVIYDETTQWPTSFDKSRLD